MSKSILKIRSISLGVFLNEKEIVHVGSCGNISKDLNKDLYKKLTKIKTNSNFQKIASNGSAYNFVKPEVVCEIKLLDFQGDKSNDDPIRHLKFEYLNNSLNATGRARSISILTGFLTPKSSCASTPLAPPSVTNSPKGIITLISTKLRKI